VRSYSQNNMATPNYQFEKRRKELEKKAKKEEKRKRKAAGIVDPEDAPEAGTEATPAEPVPPTT
jgi:hypothetical protein